MAKKVNKLKSPTVNAHLAQSQKIKSKKQASQYDKIFQENLEKLLPLLIKEVLGMDIVHREQLPTRVQHTQEREPDIFERIQLKDLSRKALHIEVQLRDDRDMNFRLGDYYFYMLRTDPHTPIEQYVIYIGNEKPKHITGFYEDENMSFRYNVILISEIPYKLFLESNTPEVIVFSLLGDLGKTAAKDVAIAAAQRINALEEGELRKKKFFKQLRIISNIRNLAPLIDKVMENITQYFVPERDPWYNKGFQLGEEKGEEKNKREFTALFLLSTGFPVEKIAQLVDKSVDYVRAIQQEVTQIRILLEAKNSATKTAKTMGVPYIYVKKIKETISNP